MSDANERRRVEVELDRQEELLLERLRGQRTIRATVVEALRALARERWAAEERRAA